PTSPLGDLRTGAATQDPLGWALTYHSTRCQSCHDRGAPWMLAHQTGLAWMCPQHRIYLRALCSRCTPRGHALAGAPIGCPHHTTPALAEDSEAVLDLQSRLLHALDEPSSSLSVPPL